MAYAALPAAGEFRGSTSLSRWDSAPNQLVRSPSPPPKRGSNLACLNCRKIKTKCGKTEPTDDRCKRCVRLNLSCEYRPHHRGKKLKESPEPSWTLTRSVSSSSDLTLPYDDTIAESSSGPSRRLLLAEQQAALGLRNPSALVSDPLLPLSSLGVQEFGTAGISFSQQNAVSSPPSDTESGDSPVAFRPSFKLARLASSLRDDVLQLGLVQLADAVHLFDRFVQNLDPGLGLLDPRLHTFDYTRTSCPLLFSSILAAASRVTLQDLHNVCERACEALLNLAGSLELCSLDHVQAILVSCVQEDEPSAIAPRRLNRAIGYAYELGLHTSFSNHGSTAGVQAHPAVTSANFLEALELRSRQRTWIHLCLLEDRFSSSGPQRGPRPVSLIRPQDVPLGDVWTSADSSSAGPSPGDWALLRKLRAVKRASGQHNRVVGLVEAQEGPSYSNPAIPWTVQAGSSNEAPLRHGSRSYPGYASTLHHDDMHFAGHGGPIPHPVGLPGAAGPIAPIQSEREPNGPGASLDWSDPSARAEHAQPFGSFAASPFPSQASYGPGLTGSASHSWLLEGPLPQHRLGATVLRSSATHGPADPIGSADVQPPPARGSPPTHPLQPYEAGPMHASNLAMTTTAVPLQRHPHYVASLDASAGISSAPMAAATGRGTTAMFPSHGFPADATAADSSVAAQIEGPGPHPAPQEGVAFHPHPHPHSHPPPLPPTQSQGYNLDSAGSNSRTFEAAQGAPGSLQWL